MKYPDGSTINTGDLVWWDEGGRAGHVQAIAESREEYESWGLEGPCLFLTDVHPYDPEETGWMGVAYDLEHLESEGVRVLSAEERADLERAIVAAGMDGRIIRLQAGITGGVMTHWLFRERDAEQEVPPVRVPLGGAMVERRRRA